VSSICKPLIRNYTNSVHLSSKTFAQAAKLAEQIESLETELEALLRGADSVGEAPAPTKAAPKRRVSSQKKAPAEAPKSTEEGRGTLRPAVVAILQKSKKPLRTAEIYDALVQQGYQFTFKDAKKVLGIRLYKMLGVQPLGGGLFKAK
jgi:hypothetical protein